MVSLPSPGQLVTMGSWWNIQGLASRTQAGLGPVDLQCCGKGIYLQSPLGGHSAPICHKDRARRYMYKTNSTGCQHCTEMERCQQRWQRHFYSKYSHVFMEKYQNFSDKKTTTKNKRKMPQGIMDRFFERVNQKVNLRRPNACRLWHRYFKGQIFWKTHPKINFGCTSFWLQGW